MKYATLTSGQSFPLLGLGTWQSSEKEVYLAIRKAIEIGYRHIDCAPVYMNESAIGKAIKDAIKEGDTTRDALWITSKLWNSDHSPDDVAIACKKTLKDLQIDYIDLYLMHWPIAQKHFLGPTLTQNGKDFISPNELPIAKTWNAMEALSNQGLAKSIGVSNFSISRLKDLLNQGPSLKPTVNQVENHPLLAQNELLNFCKKNNIILTAYSPLGSKNQSKTFKERKNPSLLDNPVINDIAENHNATPAQILLAWQLQRGVAVIPKSVHPARLQQNFDSIYVELSTTELETINQMDIGFRFIDGSIFTIEGSPYTLKWLWE